MDAAIIHTVYLINCASRDRTIRRKSLNSLTIALRSGAALGVNGVVLHAGSALGGDVKRAVTRAGKVIRAALDDSEGCPLHLEDTAGSGGTLGRSFSELAALIEAAGGDERLGLCLDSCHLWASGYDVRTADGLREVIDECVGMVGVERLGSVHANDSKTGLGSNVDRHAPLGEGELGAKGCAVFLSEPRFDGLPAIFEGPGIEGKAPSKADVDAMKRLRKRGLSARRR